MSNHGSLPDRFLNPVTKKPQGVLSTEDIEREGYTLYVTERDDIYRDGRIAWTAEVAGTSIVQWSTDRQTAIDEALMLAQHIMSMRAMGLGQRS